MFMTQTVTTSLDYRGHRTVVMLDIVVARVVSANSKLLIEIFRKLVDIALGLWKRIIDSKKVTEYLLSRIEIIHN